MQEPEAEELMRLLLEAGADPNGIELNPGQEQSTPLRTAAERGHASAVRILLAAGADPRSRDDYGWTALRISRGSHRVAASRELLEYCTLVKLP